MLIPLSGIQAESSAVAQCPDIILEIFNSDLTALDADVFTYNIGDTELKVETTDTNMVGIFDLKLVARYQDEAYAAADVLEFTVEIVQELPLYRSQARPSLEEALTN